MPYYVHSKPKPNKYCIKSKSQHCGVLTWSFYLFNFLKRHQKKINKYFSLLTVPVKWWLQG